MKNPNAIFGAVTRVEGESFQFEGERTARVAVPGYRALLEDLQRRGMPAYVEVDANNTITRVRVPIIVRVESITGDMVMFEFSHARHTLPRDEDYEDLVRRLEEAKENGEWIAVTETDEHEIIDVRPYGPLFELPRREPPGLLRRFVFWKWWPWCWFRSVSAARAQQLFDLCAAPTCDPLTLLPAGCIPFLYPDDGCWGRAHEMARLMIAAGASPRKVWIFGNLRTPTRNNPRCFVVWGWHVAPTLCVRKKWWWFSTTEKVIDPALFTTPVTTAQWKGVQGDPAAQLFSEPAAAFYRYPDGAITTDPAYTRTNAVLATYRIQLQVRSIDPMIGPPPYAACP